MYSYSFRQWALRDRAVAVTDRGTRLHTIHSLKSLKFEQIQLSSYATNRNNSLENQAYTQKQVQARTIVNYR